MKSRDLVIDEMKKLGLSEYEVKAYLSLLQQYPLNGYMLSKQSGIPRSRIYEVLDSLKAKGLVYEDDSEKSSQYVPIEPQLMLSDMKKSFNDIFDTVENYTKKVFNRSEDENMIKIVKGRDKILQLLKSLIENSKERINISIWEEEVEELKEEFNRASKRGVKIKGIYFGKDNRFKEVVSHRRIERYLSEKKYRYLIVIIDNSIAISGVVSRGESSQVTWTRDKEYLEISQDYIVHDLMVNKFIESLYDDQKKSVEDYLDKLRKDYFDFSDEEFSNFE